MAALWERLNPPEGVATAQRSWDRNALVYRMRQAGYTLEAIAGQMGVSRERIRQREAKFYRTRGKLSPIERWLRGWREELRWDMEQPAPVRLDVQEVIRRARHVVERAEQAKDHKRWQEAEAARIAEILRRREERRREILSEQEEANKAAVAEAQATLIEGKVTPKDILLCNAAMAVVGHFDGDERDPKTQGQLAGYWRAISRGMESVEAIPVCFYRFNAILAFAYENEAFRQLIGATVADDHVGLPVLSDEFCAIVAAMPVRWVKETDTHFKLTPIRCEPEGTMQLARLYYEIGGRA